MNRFGEIADELTDLIEELEHPDLADDGKALKAALERAFARACEAERIQRLKAPAEPQTTAKKRVARRAAAGLESAGSAVVIKLPLAWRMAAAARRRGG